MKHEAMVRAMSELDDELICAAREYRPRARKTYIIPRVLAAAACLALIVTAAVLSLRAPQTAVLIDGTKLAAEPIAVAQAMPLALDGRSADAQPLFVQLTFRCRAGQTLTAAVSAGTLTAPDDAGAPPVTACTVSNAQTLLWTVDSPDTGAVYTLTFGGETVALRFDGAAQTWVAERC